MRKKQLNRYLAVGAMLAFALSGCAAEMAEGYEDVGEPYDDEMTRDEEGARLEAEALLEDDEVASSSAALTLEEIATGDFTADYCWSDSYGRGVGTIPDACRAGEEKKGALCYPRCKRGFYGVGPVCWQKCPSGYIDDGAFCRRNAHIFSSNNSECPWYDVCGLTFARGCSKCPSGYINDGCTCRRNAHIFAKQSYGRGAGTPMVCRSGLEYDAGLCYDECDSGYDGIGPVCWSYCPPEAPVGCGAGCAKSQSACAETIISQVTSSLEMAANIGAAVMTFGSSAGATYSAKLAIGASERAALKAAIKKGLRETGKDLTEDALEAAAEELTIAAVSGESMDWAALDPLGVASVVEAFYFPLCSEM